MNASKEEIQNKWEETVLNAKAEKAKSLKLECEGIKDISLLSSLSDLEQLELTACEKVKDFKPLKALSNLEDFTLDGAKRIGFLSSMKHLKKLELRGCDISSIYPLRSLRNLTSLNLYAIDTGNLYPLIYLSKLERLSLFEIGDLDLTPLLWLTNLKELELDSVCFDICQLSSLYDLECLNLTELDIEDLSPLSTLTNLSRLELVDCQEIEDLSPLSSLVNLRDLVINACFYVDMSQLSSLTWLRHLSLGSLHPDITDLNFLRSMRDLESLDFWGIENIKDFSSFCYLSNLQSDQLSLPDGVKIEDLLPPSSILHLHRDEAGRLHNDSGPALACKEGLNLYYWHGTGIPSDWIKKGLPSAEAALKLDNAELRRAACEMIGWAKILEELDAFIIDENADPEIGTLLEADFPETGPERFLKVRCGTGREFVIPVPPDMKTAKEANAWTWGLKASQYRPEVRT